MRPARLALALLALAGCAGSAHAQLTVYDPTAVAKLISQAQTELNQLEQLKAQLATAQHLDQAFNIASNVNALAAGLSAQSSRAFLPDATSYVAASSSDARAGLGALGTAAAAIRAANRIYTPAASDPAGAELEQSGQAAALNLALGEQVAGVGAARLQGLQQLQTAVGQAADVRAVMDLQARIAAEQAMIANDQMRLQGLAMAQAAQVELARQRDRERAAKQHSDAQSLFRSALP